MSAARPATGASLNTGPSWGAPIDDGFDDPKLTRELAGPHGPSVVSASPAQGRGPVPGPVPVVVASVNLRRPAGPGPSAAPKPLVPSPAARPGPRGLGAAAATPVPAAAPAHVSSSPAPAQPSKPPLALPVPPGKRLAMADQTVAVHPAADLAAARQSNGAASSDPAPAAIDGADGRWPYAPRLKFGYRRFSFAHAVSAAPAITQGAVLPTSPETFESLSLDVYPISWYLRVGLSSAFGWQSGAFDRSGDYFLAESGSVGFQLPGRFTPFVEGLAGAGYMRRTQGTSDRPSVYWQLGVDAGVEIYFARRAYLSLAAGYLHPANLFLDQQNLNSVKLDTWSLKIGLGI